ncbi:leucyl aminopeptidase family protein [Belliella sp. DSM 111904]|uniref:Leucyl aminopeptidase family protein n=1 Tax=Belliella filtrata TaxID=2923435 RepID=A0ABS9UWV5_9BACT|nr:leucyl aminopeptidase family protein [Belliella filtrata]MCH7408661.1 leucyl aminopeptidase family protein [Belliella filtrata]
MKIKIHQSIEESNGLIILPFFENEAGVAFPKGLSEKSISTKLFTGKKDSHYLFEDEKGLYLLLGLGKSDTHYKTIQTAFRRVTAKHESIIENEISIIFPEAFDSDQIQAAITGLKLGTYRLAHFKKSEPKKKDWDQVNLNLFSNGSDLDKIAEYSLTLATAQLETMKMVDLPSNEATPAYLANWAKEKSKALGFKATVLERKEAEALGLHAFLAVSQGSSVKKSPRFIIAEYRNEKATKHLGLVGKGVTFDTGGLNIKTAGMVHMKCDMGGAAAVLGALAAVASLSLPVNLTAIVPCVENSIDKDSFLPSDVINSYSGKTIEIIDTDAEGRLILADGLSYLIKNYEIDTVIDLATLTGSAVGTFGYECAALFSKDQVLLDALQKAGSDVGEKMWPLPMWDTYASEMDSEIADIKNYHGKPFAGAITAAKFLEAFTDSHASWAHIDIAGTAFGDSEFAKTKHATAYGVHLIVKLIENM